MTAPLPLAYFHGMPGGPGEWAINAPDALRDGVVLADRNDPQVTPARIAEQLGALFPGGMVLVGFSAGAFAALQVAALLRERVRQLHLISPAAPLQLGQFLPQMAGGPIFRLAARHPRLFALVVRAQSLLARRAPRFLLGRLFATAQGGDRPLLADAAFVDGMAEVLRAGLGSSPGGFRREVLAYVQDWRAELSLVQAPVTIWQGDADNWTPPAMGQALHTAMPGSELVMLAGCSHYSALRAALERLLNLPCSG